MKTEKPCVIQSVNEETLLTVDELATKLKQNPFTVYRRSRKGGIPGRVKLGGAVRFRESAILQWIKESEQREAEQR